MPKAEPFGAKGNGGDGGGLSDGRGDGGRRSEVGDRRSVSFCRRKQRGGRAEGSHARSPRCRGAGVGLPYEALGGVGSCGSRAGLARGAECAESGSAAQAGGGCLPGDTDPGARGQPPPADPWPSLLLSAASASRVRVPAEGSCSVSAASPAPERACNQKEKGRCRGRTAALGPKPPTRAESAREFRGREDCTGGNRGNRGAEEQRDLTPARPVAAGPESACPMKPLAE